MNYLLIGGQTECPEGEIESFILNKTTNPCILYVALASTKYLYSYNLFKNKIKCPLALLTEEDLINNTYEEKFKSANILYFAGGSTELLIGLVKKYNLEPYFKDKDLLVGVSAGAIMLSSFGMGDKDAFIDDGHYYNFKMIEGLGLLNISFCPHYQKEELVMFDDECKKYKLDAYALEDDTAIYFEDARLKKVIKNVKSNSVYFLSKENYILTPLYGKE